MTKLEKQLVMINSKLDALIQYTRVVAERTHNIEHVLRIAHQIPVFTPEQKAWLKKVEKQRLNGGAPNRR